MGMGMGTKIVGMGTHSAGTGKGRGHSRWGRGGGWGLTQWGRGWDGDRDNGDGWDGDEFLSPCSSLAYMQLQTAVLRLLCVSQLPITGQH